MKQVMVRRELIPHMNKIGSLLSNEFRKIEDNDDGDRGEVMLSIALSILLYICNGDHDLASAIALRLIRDNPSMDDNLQAVRCTSLSPEFAKALPTFYDDDLTGQLFTKARKH